jgi:hypothetical protein
MALFRTFVVAALLATLAVPGAAGAAQRAPKPTRVSAPSPLAAATDAATRYWSAVPCNGHVKVVARQPLAKGADPTTDAWVTFDSSLGANNLAAPAGSYSNCTISFGSFRWPAASSMSEDWELLCTTMVHEVGHLLGRAHDLTPGSVMAPVFTDRSSVPSVCRAAARARAAGRASAR